MVKYSIAHIELIEQLIFAKWQGLKLTDSVKLEPVANAVAMVDPLSTMPSKKVATIARFIAIIPSRKTPLDKTPVYPQKFPSSPLFF